MTDQTIWEEYYEPFDSNEYMDNLGHKTIHQLIIEKKIINELEEKIKDQNFSYRTKEQRLSYQRLLKRLELDYPIKNTTDKEKKINNPNRHKNGDGFRFNCIKENRYKIKNKQKIFDLIDTLIENQKTYNPNEKIECECGGCFIKKHFARHLETKKHLNYLTNLTE